MESIYDTFKHIPLFAGLSDKNLLDITGRHSFEFAKYADGETIVKAEDPCTDLLVVVSGKVRSSITGHNGRVVVSQTLNAPDVIAPDHFFGRYTTYPCTVKAIGGVGVMRISKKHYLEIIKESEVCLFNYLNLLSVNAQKAVEGVLSLTSGDLSRRIAFWIVALTQQGGEDIIMESRQRDLYTLFGVPRQSLLAALDEMKSDGFIDYRQGEISVVDRRRLMALLAR